MYIWIPPGMLTDLQTFIREHLIAHEQQVQSAGADSTWHRLEMAMEGAAQESKVARNHSPMDTPPKSEEVLHLLHGHAIVRKKS